MTTFEELLYELPNGLHDAQLIRFEIDYSRRELKLEFDAWIGDMEAEAREIYRRGLLTVEGLGFFLVQPPHPNPGYNVYRKTPVRIDAGDGIPSQAGEVSLPTLPPDHTLSWIFIDDQNSFVLFSSRSASLSWIGEPENWAGRQA